MFENYEKYAPFILRLGPGLLWLLFGIDKFINPINWVGYIPSWMPLPFGKEVLIFILAVVETIIGVLLLIGFWTRTVAALSALMLVPIVFSLGYNEVAIRDVAVLFATIALALRTNHPFSVDGALQK